MPIDVEKIARQTKKNAADLLRTTGLIDELARFGVATITGSYKLDLMVDGDIDIYLVDKFMDKEKSITILNCLIRKGKFNGYLYYNYYQKKRPGFPRGYYIGLKTRFRGQRWKIDIWLTDKIDKPSVRFMERVAGQLDDKTKKTILALKYSVKTKGLDIASHLIYRAVLDHKVKGLVGLKRLASLYKSKEN